MSMSFILTGKSSDFTTCFNSVILDPIKQYEAALLSLIHTTLFQISLKKRTMYLNIIMEKLGKLLALVPAHMN